MRLFEGFDPIVPTDRLFGHQGMQAVKNITVYSRSSVFLTYFVWCLAFFQTICLCQTVKTWTNLTRLLIQEHSKQFEDLKSTNDKLHF